MVSFAESQVLEQSPENEVVLSVNNVSKKFCRDLKRSLFYGVQDMASELVGMRNATDKLRPQEFWALNDVSFELRRGEALGLVGKNGSGKSTLLRIIAGLIKPDAGSVEVKGRVAPLIALGAGFSPVLTGRENIYANMSILGLSKKEIDERFDEVVEFAEIGDAIDAPVQSYSSGMAARLGFSCAIHTEPDILLIDEVLAVGDVRFRAKCSRRLSKLRQKGTSFILVSHQSNLLLNVCDIAAYLSKGNVLKLGDTVSVVNQYETDLFETPKSGSFGKIFLSDKAESESSGLDITRLFFRAVDETITEEIVTGEEIIFCVGCKARTLIKNACLFIAIKEIAGDGDLILHLSNLYDQKSFDLPPGEHEIRLQMPTLGLKPNSYTMEVYIKQGSLSILDTIMSFNFIVKPKNGLVTRGLFYQPRRWEIIKEE